MANDKNVKNTAAGMPDFSGFVETATGFPPYWNPEPGKKFFGQVVGIDFRDPDFIRYTLLAGMDMDCATGPADDATPVKVLKGERFNVSVYASLPLDRFLGEYILVESIKKVKGGKGDMWRFKLLSSPETKAVVAKRESIFEWNGTGKPVVGARLPAYIGDSITGTLPAHVQNAEA
jgi:hypothetical protein